MDEFITVTGLKKIYRTGGQAITALDIPAFSFPRRGFVSISGPSGSGKTTFLNVAGMLDRPTAGSIMVDGCDVAAASETERSRIRRANFGFIFQTPSLIPTLTVWENVVLPLVPRGLAKSDAKNKADRLLQQVGLSPRRNHLPSELSQGQQQRVAVARALIDEPKVIFADEPTANLDQENAGMILGLLTSMCVSRGMLFVLAGNGIELPGQAPDVRLALEQGKMTGKQ